MNRYRFMHQTQLFPPSFYIPIIWKFWIGQGFALGWMMFSIWLSIPWVNDLRPFVGIPLAILIITGLAYIPGYLNAFLLSSLLMDKQPLFKTEQPIEPITILIAAKNEANNIRETLQYIANQDYRGDIHVILIDNGSTDGTAQLAATESKKLELSLTCLQEQKPGKHFALNTGLNDVETELVITLDADTLLHKSAIRFLVARLVSSPEDVCAVAGAVLVRNSRESFWTRIQEWDYYLGIASVKRLQGLYQGTLVAQGAFSLYRTEIIKKVGGWPDAIGEDIVLTWNFLQDNWRVFFEPLSVAFTNVPVEFQHLARQRSRWARGMVEGLKRFKPWKQPRIASKHLTGINLVMPYLDLAYTLCWLPGLLLSFFGIFLIVGPHTLFVLPITLASNMVFYRYQRHIFRQLSLRVRSNWIGFFAYVFLYQMLMSPVSIWGYLQEILAVKRVWK